MSLVKNGFDTILQAIFMLYNNNLDLRLSLISYALIWPKHKQIVPIICTSHTSDIIIQLSQLHSSLNIIRCGIVSL